MVTDYIPMKDAALLTWSTELSQHLTATPLDFGITAPMAASLAAKVSAFSDALAAATNGQTRGKHTIFLKDEARASLVSDIRAVVGQIQGTVTVTNAQRSVLNIPARDTQPTPRHAPATGPGITVKSVSGRTIKIELQDLENPLNRGKPPTASGATIFTFSGSTPPAAGAPGWAYQGQATRRYVELVLPADSAPETVWISGVWYTERGELSPASTPISVNLAAVIGTPVAMKLAA